MAKLNNWEQERIFDEMLDSCHDAIVIGNLTYAASDVLRSTDPIAYQVALSDYFDDLVSEGRLYYDEDGDINDEETPA